MPDDTQDVTPSQPSLDELLAQIVAADEAGQPIDGELLAAKHPQFAADLREFVANRDRMQQLAAPLRNAGPQAGGNNGHLRGKIRYFGDYELIEEIAAGGMGIVYKARQVSLNRLVAVKMILRGTLATEDDVKRFRAEAEAAANLQHPGIVAIHEVGIHEGQHYFSMDYVDGQSLGQLPREKPLSARQAAEYVREAAVAVHAAHQQGTLHRDLKPSNILIDRQGRVRITDFGLAKRITGNSDLTITGQILGTPSYMPPEQALSKKSLIGTASDVYSLGAVLYELLAGRPPFRGESPAETLRQVETLDPISPRLLNPATPRDLETICLKCLEKEPHKRYGTSQLLADDLGRFLRHEPILARPISRLARAWRWCRRKPVVASLSGAVLFLLVVVIPGLLAFHNRQIGAELDRTQKAERQEKTAKLDEKEAKRVALDRLAMSNLHLARAARLSGAVGQRYDSLKAAEDGLKIINALQLSADERQRRIAEYRNEAIAALALPDMRIVRKCTVEGVGRLMEADPEQSHFAWGVNPEGSVSIRRMMDGSELVHYPGARWFAWFSPDGRLLASQDLMTNQLSVWRVGEQSPLWSVPWLRPDIFTPCKFSPDSRWLALPQSTKSIAIYDSATGQLLREWKTPGIPTQMDFHPSGKQLAVTCDLDVFQFDLVTDSQTPQAKRIDVLSPPLAPAQQKFTSSTLIGISSGRALAWHPDGRRLAALNRERNIEICDVEKGRLEATMQTNDRGQGQLAFDSSGQLLASVSTRSELRLWHADTGKLLLRVPDECNFIRFHPTRPWLGPIRRGSEISIREVELSRVFQTLVSPVASYYLGVSVSPDSRLSAACTSEGVAI